MRPRARGAVQDLGRACPFVHPASSLKPYLHSCGPHSSHPQAATVATLAPLTEIAPYHRYSQAKASSLQNRSFGGSVAPSSASVNLPFQNQAPGEPRPTGLKPLRSQWSAESVGEEMGGRRSWRCTQLTLSNPSQAPRATPEQSNSAEHLQECPQTKALQNCCCSCPHRERTGGGWGSLAGTLWYLPTARDVVPKMCPHTRAHAVRQQVPG